MNFLFWMSVLGTIAFAVSGAVVAVRKKMDIFGINMLALTTAVGGGAIRDLLIGDTPPVMFRDPIYVLIALLTANVVFLFIHFHKKAPSHQMKDAYEILLFLSDTMGLAAFTVNGVSIGMALQEPTLFLCVFLGVITGVGGGVLRDIMSQDMPAIFVKHVYAVASIIGALVTYGLWHVASSDIAMTAGFAVIIVIRTLAAVFRWNLPRAER